MTLSNPISIQVETTRKLVIRALEGLKAENIIALDVRNQASFTDFMVFASGTSTRHVSSISSAVIEEAELANIPPYGVEGLEVGEWVLVDLGDVIVHVMLPDTRQFYEIEKLWSEELIVANSE